MRYTVVVKQITSTNGDYVRARYNRIPKRIIKFLLKHHFSFKVGIANNTVNAKTAEYYIEVYTKNTLSFKTSNHENYLLNEKLLAKLKHLGKSSWRNRYVR